MARLTNAQKNALTTIAYYVAADGISRNVDGMSGFKDFYVKQLSAGDRAIISFFVSEVKKAPKDIADTLDKENHGTPS